MKNNKLEIGDVIYQIDRQGIINHIFKINRVTPTMAICGDVKFNIKFKKDINNPITRIGGIDFNSHYKLKTDKLYEQLWKQKYISLIKLKTNNINLFKFNINQLKELNEIIGNFINKEKGGTR